jgi:hypothetical protein
MRRTGYFAAIAVLAGLVTSRPLCMVRKLKVVRRAQVLG